MTAPLPTLKTEQTDDLTAVSPQIKAQILAEANQQGLRCVRIVHGKGLGSPGREPVLKGLVRGWLMQRAEVWVQNTPNNISSSTTDSGTPSSQAMRGMGNSLKG